MTGLGTEFVRCWLKVFRICPDVRGPLSQKHSIIDCSSGPIRLAAVFSIGVSMVVSNIYHRE